MTTPPTTPEAFLASRYILDAPSLEVTAETGRKPNARKGMITFPTRVQVFSLTYYSDYIDAPHDGEDEADLLSDDEANELARMALRQYVEAHRLPVVGRVIQDEDVDGAESVRPRHELEFTITYVIEEDVTGVRPEFLNFDPHEEGEVYEDPTDRRLRLNPPKPARVDVMNNAGRRSNLAMTDGRVALGEFFAEVRAGGGRVSVS
ncbi:hypothetical protein MARCHEWKA_02920 [Brevundimonas phage vB_BpoS-Marchewka]|uniref:Uncharacterized protein n=1 Tax=Brevundimonas phage vB_BpoS-Marchewka TaxID=2948604 RepID=A0A9E7SR61_9CAUD|nr:hypothetical protein MARCHEWKA_02920 [Brevundimonas phage vB_BpoS-Marchewka]UTC29251.1 hypothetical protein BAMBUS_01690 [Brevundimonas phage vB_BpoS-Bambus]